MSAPLQALAERFAFNDRFLDMLTEGFTEADWLRRAGPGNHAQWLLGHLAGTRRASLRGFGQEADEQPWEQHFGMGHEPTQASDDIAPALLREAFIKNGADLRRWLASLDEAQAAAAFRPFPDGSRTVSGVAHFLHFHESYHLGQIGLLRRVCGKTGVV
jgi:uncharacterized damage-inducible protein DinB